MIVTVLRPPEVRTERAFDRRVSAHRSAACRARRRGTAPIDRRCVRSDTSSPTIIRATPPSSTSRTVAYQSSPSSGRARGRDRPIARQIDRPLRDAPHPGRWSFRLRCDRCLRLARAARAARTRTGAASPFRSRTADPAPAAGRADRAARSDRTVAPVSGVIVGREARNRGCVVALLRRRPPATTAISCKRSSKAFSTSPKSTPCSASAAQCASTAAASSVEQRAATTVRCRRDRCCRACRCTSRSRT